MLQNIKSLLKKSRAEDSPVKFGDVSRHNSDKTDDDGSILLKL